MTDHRERFEDRPRDPWDGPAVRRNQQAHTLYLERAHRHHHAVGGYSSALRSCLFVAALAVMGWAVTFGLIVWGLS